MIVGAAVSSEMSHIYTRRHGVNPASNVSYSKLINMHVTEGMYVLGVIVLYLEYSCTFLYAFVCKFKNIRLLFHARFRLIKE